MLAQVDAAPDTWREVLLAQLRGAIAGGVTAVQIRERDLEAREHVRLVRACVELTRGTACQVIVNDRLDVALAAGADGVHLRERSLSIADARRLLHELGTNAVPDVPGTLAPAFLRRDRRGDENAVSGSFGSQQSRRARKILIGRSVHSATTAVRARNADYLIAGSVFETASKPGGQRWLGLDGLRDVVDAAGKCPVWAIGGVTQERMAAVAACGVHGVAAIGAFLPPARSTDVEGDVKKNTEALRFSLDRCS